MVEVNTESFPTLPPYRGYWRAVYYTPIRGSREKLAAFVISVGDDGQTCLRSTLREPFIDAAFLHQAAGVRAQLSFVRDTLSVWLSEPTDDWLPPLSGFEMGPAHPTHALNIRQIAAQGIVMEAAFAEPAFADLNQD